MRCKNPALVLALLFAAYGFLGMPVPGWLEGAVSSLVGTITAVAGGFLKVLVLARIFIGL